MKEKFRQFMTGRYGADQLSRFIMACGMVTLVCYMIFRGSLWYYLTLILLVWNYYRALSRNYEKRYQENLKFLSLKNQVLGLFRKNPAADKEHACTAAPAVNRKVECTQRQRKNRDCMSEMP